MKDLRATVAFPFSAAFSNCFRLWFSGDPRLDRLRVCDPGGALANGLLSALCSSRRGGSDRFSFTPPSSNSDIRSVAWRRAAGSKDSRVDIPASTTGTCPSGGEICHGAVEMCTRDVSRRCTWKEPVIHVEVSGRCTTVRRHRRSRRVILRSVGDRTLIFYFVAVICDQSALRPTLHWATDPSTSSSSASAHFRHPSSAW